MADLNELQSSQTVKVVGSDATGLETGPVNATNSALHTTLKDSSGQQVGTEANPIFTRTSVAVVSSFPSIEAVLKKVVSAGSAEYYTKPIVARTAMREFTFGGRGVGEATLGRYVDATTQSVNNVGSMETDAEVTAWTDSGLLPLTSKTRSTAQAYAGSSSMLLSFSKSDTNNYPEVTEAFPSPIDLSAWRYVSGAFYQTPSAGASVVRTVSIVLTSGTAKRFYSITLTSDTAAQWFFIKTEIERPTSESGTGFDVNNVSSISLRLVDSASRVGTIYWDAINFIGAVTIIQKIYTPGQTVRLSFDPVKVFDVGETLLLMIKNNDTAAKEFQATAAGVNI